MEDDTIFSKADIILFRENLQEIISFSNKYHGDQLHPFIHLCDDDTKPWDLWVFHGVPVFSSFSDKHGKNHR